MKSNLTNAALADGSLRMVPVIIPVAVTITGVRWFQVTQGSYTSDNYNGWGLYTVSSGTATLVASSTDDGNIWKGTGNTWQTKALSSTYNAAAGVYYLAALYNSSAETTAPSIGGGAALNNDAVSPFDFTNSNRLVGALGSHTSMPSPITMSGLSNTTVMYAPFLY